MADELPIADGSTVPLFALAGTVLLPHTELSLHVFEPRYRQLMDDVIDGSRLVAVATLDVEATPEPGKAPPIFGVAGLGRVIRSVRLPDGRYNVGLYGVCRLAIGQELDETPEKQYRRAVATPLREQVADDKSALDASVAALLVLCNRVASDLAGGPDHGLGRLYEITNPGALADSVAAAIVHDLSDRQRILAEPDVGKRLSLTATAIAELVLKADAAGGHHPPVGWGVETGLA